MWRNVKMIMIIGTTLINSSSKTRLTKFQLNYFTRFIWFGYILAFFA